MKNYALPSFILLLLTISALAQTPEMVFKKALPSTVNIIGSKQSGSGFFVLPDVVVTNFHVIEGEGKLEVHVNGSQDIKSVVGVVGYDIKADLVLLKVNGKGQPLKLGSNPQVGQTVFTIGRPLGFSATFTSGLISAIRESGDDVKMLQISVPVSPGNSGGPLINLQSELVGVVVSSVMRGQNLNFAIHVDHLTTLLQNRLSEPLPLSSFLKTVQITGSRSATGYSNEDAFIADVLQMLNGFRKGPWPSQFGLPACTNDLKWNDLLAQAALTTLDKIQGNAPMTVNTYDGQTSMQRAQIAGVKANGVYEMLIYGFDDIVDCLNAWAKFAQFRNKMLDPRVKEVGIARKGGYWSMMLAY
ncbi:MAG: trypsin-like peptidase domain-containing protein [Cytophagales bacterium]|nr:trypsin-like peptidase domain-containing protein [Bernardetiaceae bacterium]MDW8205138.1 trypsin-like peptidase domain-containing protein [Cytophagales bacterium]